MLFKQIHLKGIRSGAINLAFRRWKRPTVKEGSLLKTAIGQVEIIEIAPLADSALILPEDVQRAGFESLEQLLSSLGRPDEQLYKIALRYHSEDPRIALRESTFTEETYETLRRKLDRMDSAAPKAWTLQVLQAIKNHPLRRAADLAQLLEMEKDPLKVNIRKLKNLGLTISHETGYELSSLGKSYLDRVCENL